MCQRKHGCYWKILSLQQMYCLPIWLKGDLVISRDLTEILFQLLEKLLITLCLIQRHEGVDVGKFPPGDWLSMSKRNVFMNELAQWGSINSKEAVNRQAILAKQRPTHSKACRVHGLGDGTHSSNRAKCSLDNDTQVYPRLFCVSQNKHDSPWVQTSCSASLCRIPAVKDSFSGMFT